MVKGGFRVRQKPRVFFSYSYMHQSFLKPTFYEAAIESDVTPIFADEHIRAGESILKRLQQLMISSDLFVIDLSISSHGVYRELMFAEMVNKPFFIISQKHNGKRPSSSLFLNKYATRYYEDIQNLKQILIEIFNTFKKNFINKDNLKIIAEEDNLIDIIKGNMDKNVMILGRDSDTTGVAKMSRIKTIVMKQGYEPIIMRDLPDIKEISYEGKMIRVAGHCRFLLAEDSRASGHIDELNICKMGEFITGTLKQVGQGSTWMQAHYPSQYMFFERFCYEDAFPQVKDALCENRFKTLELAAEAAIDWAESVIKSRYDNYSKTLYY